MDQQPVDAILNKDELLNSWIQSSVDGVFICDIDQRILLHNPALEKILGQDETTLRQHRLLDFFKQLRPVPISLSDSSIDKYIHCLQDWEVVHPTGNACRSLVNINEVHHAGTTYYLGIVHKISSITEKQISLDREKTLLEKYLYITNSIILELDWQAKILVFNHKAEEITGYSAAEALGRSWFDLVLPKGQVDAFKKNWTDIFENKKDLEEFFTHTILTKDGRPKIIRWHSIFNKDKQVSETVIASGMDITATKEAERKLNILNLGLEKEVTRRTQELVQVVNRLLSTNKTLDKEIAEREKIQKELRNSQEELRNSLEKEMELNSLKSRFLSMASHEFRTPLATILSSVSLLERYDESIVTEQTEKKQKHYKRIQSSIKHITQMLEDFFSISNFEDGQISYSPAPIDLHGFCQNVVDSFQNIIKSNQSLVYESSDDQLQLHSDPKLLKNVLINLLSNASKYSRDGQTIFLKVRADDTSIYFDVIDEGVGIPKSEQKYLFTRFFRAKNVTNIKGTGIGLNIVKAYLKLLEGEISLKSEIDKGSTFTVSIPKTRSQ